VAETIDVNKNDQMIIFKNVKNDRNKNVKYVEKRKKIAQNKRKPLKRF